MRRSLLRWLCIGVSVLIIGPIVGAVFFTVRGVDGSEVATALVSKAPAWGLFAALICIALTAIAGLFASLLVGSRDGLFCAGLTLAWAAWHSGHFKDLARAVDLHDPLARLAAEGFLLGLATAVVGIAIVWLGGGDTADDADTPLGKQSLIGLAAMCVVGGAVAWGVARTGMVGQTFAAAMCAGIFGALAARVFGHGCSAKTLMLAIPILATASPLLAMTRIHASFGETVYADALPGMARVMPLDWCAGILAGLPLGLSWAHSIVEQHHAEPTKRPRPRTA